MLSDLASDQGDEQIDRNVEAPFAVLIVVGLQIALAAASISNSWSLWHLRGWVWLVPIVPELLLVAALALHRRRRLPIIQGRRRAASLALVAIVAAANFIALMMLIGSLLTSQAHSGSQLLLSGLTIWGTNVVTFGLFFWEMDASGPDARLASGSTSDSPGFKQRDFQFPQMENPQMVSSGRNWKPHLIDYVFISFTNSIAFSPTDAMPLTKRAKALMMAEASISAVTILLVAARAVNILN